MRVKVKRSRLPEGGSDEGARSLSCCCLSLIFLSLPPRRSFFTPSWAIWQVKLWRTKTIKKQLIERKLILIHVPGYCNDVKITFNKLIFCFLFWFHLPCVQTVFSQHMPLAHETNVCHISVHAVNSWLNWNIFDIAKRIGHLYSFG